MLAKRTLFGIACLLLSGSLNAKEVDVTPGGVFNLSENAVKFATRIATLPSGISCVNANAWRWGILRKCPSHYISFLEGSLNGKLLFIPYSAFSDLANPTSFEIESIKHKKRFLLKIKGGSENAFSYTATLTFDAQGTLLEKNVHSHLNPKQDWERTTYKFE